MKKEKLIVAFVKKSPSNIAGGAKQTPIPIGYEGGCGPIGTSFVAAFEPGHFCDWLQSAAHSLLRDYERYTVALKVPHCVLETQAVYFFVGVGEERYGKKIDFFFTMDTSVNLCLKRKSLAVEHAKLHRKGRVIRELGVLIDFEFSCYANLAGHFLCRWGAA